MTKPKKLFGLFTSILTALVCLICIFSAWILIEIPNLAERKFGKPAPNLGALKRFEFSVRLLLQEEEVRQPQEAGGQVRAFNVEHGEATFSITNRLQEEGFIRSAEALRNYLIYAGLDTSLQAGEFNLGPNLSAMEIAWILQDSTPSQITFRVLPGWRLEEIAAALPTSGLEFSQRDFLTLAYRPPARLAERFEIPPDSSLEGYLFPDRYRVERKVSVESFVETILQDFQVKVDSSIQEGFQHQGLSLFEAVTLASIIQREAVIEDEMPLIASVFYNRLNSSMKLETDPTVQYAIGFHRPTNSWWKNPLSLEDLKTNSAYNTYLNFGLPPGPICNPSLSALQAAAFPAQTPYYYFRSACDRSGRHTFAVTFSEHQQNACAE